MPKRWNLFQEAVNAVVEHAVAMGGSTDVVGQSVMYPDPDGNTDREVDVVVTTADGRTVRFCVEATTEAVPLDITKVEQKIFKHLRLPTAGNLIIVSQSGFSAGAANLASAWVR